MEANALVASWSASIVLRPVCLVSSPAISQTMMASSLFFVSEEPVFPVEGLLAVLPCLEPDRVDLGPEGAENVQQAQLTIGLCDVCLLAAVGDKRGLPRRYGLRQGADEEFPEQRHLKFLITGSDGCVGLSSPVRQQDLDPHLIGDGPRTSDSTLVARGETLGQGRTSRSASPYAFASGSSSSSRVAVLVHLAHLSSNEHATASMPPWCLRADSSFSTVQRFGVS